MVCLPRHEWRGEVLLSRRMARIGWRVVARTAFEPDASPATRRFGRRLARQIGRVSSTI